ncbi:MAG: YggS family pyridoxal phosphate-dependent enzyme [Pseudomonadota bacterium]
MSLADVQSRLVKACKAAGRQVDDVTLIAVSKVQPEDRVRAVLAQRHRAFGENRVQEAEGRWTPLKAEYPDVRLSLIGPLQTNKARGAMKFFDEIQSLDRPKLVRKLADLAQELGHAPKLMVQVNTGEEPQKAGILPTDADAFIEQARSMDLPVTGLMCIPPVDETPSLHFALLAKIAERNGLAGLSMGMSADFEQAIAFGATHVRVGSAVFGARVPG